MSAISWRDLPLHFPTCLYFTLFYMPNRYPLEEIVSSYLSNLFVQITTFPLNKQCHGPHVPGYTLGNELCPWKWVLWWVICYRPSLRKKSQKLVQLTIIMIIDCWARGVLLMTGWCCLVPSWYCCRHHSLQCNPITLFILRPFAKAQSIVKTHIFTFSP